MRHGAAARHPRKHRRTQEERREETSGAVLDATIDCLARLGYAQTTTTRIARHARVSRGALLHYYPSKEALLTAAVEHVFRRRTEEFRKAFVELPEHADRRAAAIDLLWKMFSGPTFYAWLELTVAARSDRKLHAEVARITREFATTVHQVYRELFGSSESSGRFFDLAPQFTFTFLQGLALDRITFAEAPKLEELLGVLKEIAGIALGPQR